MSLEDQDLKKTPLYDKHIKLGAKMVPFFGWLMPLEYTGIIEEHLHTRSKAGLFDIYHMGEIFLRGASSEKDVDRLVTCRITDMPIGRCRYGFLLNEDGGIIDDLIVFKISQDSFLLVVNAGTTLKDKEWIEKHISSSTVLRDKSGKTAKLDLQGPLSPDIMSQLAGKEAIKSLKRYYFTHVDIEGIKVLLSRTGYTGESGYELFFSREHADQVWDLLLKFNDVKPIGLGARDTLRLEMGYSLYGNDIDEDHTPLEANLAKFVYMEKDFIGRQRLIQGMKQGIERLLIGFICEGRRSARSHFSVKVEERTIGVVTSGTFSPCLKRGIGLCYIDREFAKEGQGIVLTDAKVEIKAVVKTIPILEKWQSGKVS